MEPLVMGLDHQREGVDLSVVYISGVGWWIGCAVRERGQMMPKLGLSPWGDSSAQGSLWGPSRRRSEA